MSISRMTLCRCSGDETRNPENVSSALSVGNAKKAPPRRILRISSALDFVENDFFLDGIEEALGRRCIIDGL